MAAETKKKSKRFKIVITVICVLVALLVISAAVFLQRMQNPAAPKAVEGKTHIACIGDSITYGVGVIGHRNTQSYPVYLQESMGDAYQVLNYGLSGRTLQDEGDMPYTEESFFEKSLDVKADTYIIMLGTNDSKPYNWNAERYETELTSFVEKYKKANPNAAIYLMQPSKCFPLKNGEVGYDIDNNVIQDEIYTIVAKVANDTDCDCIDLYTLTQNHPEWFADGVHPNAEGNKNIATYIAEAITNQ